jgi:hypothetical protein
MTGQFAISLSKGLYVLFLISIHSGRTERQYGHYQICHRQAPSASIFHSSLRVLAPEIRETPALMAMNFLIVLRPPNHIKSRQIIGAVRRMAKRLTLNQKSHVPNNGASGVVWLCKDQETNEDVALKKCCDPDDVARTDSPQAPASPFTA